MDQLYLRLNYRQFDDINDGKRYLAAMTGDMIYLQ